MIPLKKSKYKNDCKSSKLISSHRMELPDESIKELEEKCLIYTEPTDVILKNGRKQNGNLKYTIRPIQDAVEHYYNQQMKNITDAAAREKAQKMLEKYDKNHLKSTA